MLTRRPLAGLLLLAGAFAAAPAHASDSIYWTAPKDGAIRTAPASGGTPFDLYPEHGGSSGIDLDVAGNRIVWGASHDRTIRAASLAGSGPIQDLVTTSNSVGGVGIDLAGSRAVWIDTGMGSVDAGSLSGGSHTVLYPGQDYPSSVAVDDVNGRVYLAGSAAIRSAPLDGSGPVTDLYVPGTIADYRTRAVAVDPVRGFVYWTSWDQTDPSADSVTRAPLDGSGPVEVLYTGQDLPSGLAVDAAEGYLYWASPQGIQKAPIDGSGPVQTIVATDGPFYLTMLRTPLNTEAPHMPGGLTVGSQLSCSEGTWAGDVHGSFVHRPPITGFSYRWQRNGADVAGADQSTYRTSQPGEYRCVVTATNSAGSTEAASGTSTVSVGHEQPNTPPIQTLILGRAFTGRSGAIFVPIKCALPTDATLTIRFKKPTHGFRTITRNLRLRSGESRARIALPRKLRRKLLHIRRLRVRVTLTVPGGARVSRDSTLIGRVRLP